MRTKRTKVDDAGEGDGPGVLGVEHIVTIKLEQPVLDVWVSRHHQTEPTKGPSTYQLHKLNITLGITLGASGEVNHRYSTGPKGDVSTPPGSSWLSTRETDQRLRSIAFCTVTNGDMATV